MAVSVTGDASGQLVGGIQQDLEAANPPKRLGAAPRRYIARASMALVADLSGSFRRWAPAFGVFDFYTSPHTTNNPDSLDTDIRPLSSTAP